MAKPALYIVAGPNGSGKTTFALNDPALTSIPFINADIEAQRLNPASPSRAALAAGRTTLANIAREISAGRDFALETTLSGSSTLVVMRRALAAGYAIDFSYICLSSPGLNIGRVSMRVAAGGHHVPREDVLRRYSRSLDNLPAAVVLSDRVRVFDNTETDSLGPRPLLEMREQGILFLRQDLPDWFKRAFRIDDTTVDAGEHIEECLRTARSGPR